jgi:hypothetical protein
MILCLSYNYNKNLYLCISQQENKMKIISYVLSWMGHQTMMPELLNLKSFNAGEQYSEIQNSLCVFTPSIMQQLSRFSFPLFNTRHVSAYMAILRCFELSKLLHCI